MVAFNAFEFFLKIVLFTACIHTHYESRFEIEDEGSGFFSYDLRWLRQRNLFIEQSSLSVQMNGYSLEYYFHPNNSYLAVWNNNSLRIHYNSCEGKNCLDTRHLPCNNARVTITKNEVYVVVNPKDPLSIHLKYLGDKLIMAKYKNITVEFGKDD
jgi:hypothetical protein